VHDWNAEFHPPTLQHLVSLVLRDVLCLSISQRRRILANFDHVDALRAASDGWLQATTDQRTVDLDRTCHIVPVQFTAPHLLNLRPTHQWVPAIDIFRSVPPQHGSAAADVGSGTPAVALALRLHRVLRVSDLFNILL